MLQGKVSYCDMAVSDRNKGTQLICIKSLWYFFLTQSEPKFELEGYSYRSNEVESK